MVKLLYILAFLLLFANVKSQTLVNTAWEMDLGQPAYHYSNVIPYVGGSQVMLISNNYLSGIFSQSEAQLLNSDGSMAWQESFTIPGYASNYGTATYIKNSYCYASGVGLDSAGLHSNFYIYKLNQSDGSVIWDTIYAGAYAGYEVPIGIVVDDTGNVYIGGTEQVDSFEFRMTVIKYDSNGHQLWIGSYDSTGLYTGAVGMVLSGGNLVVTGFSGSNYTSWDFATVAFNLSTGARTSVSRSGNGSGAFSTPVGIMKESNRFIITGTAATSTGHTVIKTISYDSLFTQQWVTTWGDSTSANSAASSLTEDANGNPAITAYTTGSNGAKQTAILSYNGGTSSLNFATTLSAPNSANDAQGISIGADANSIYSAASVNNGSTHSMVTTAIDYSGNVRWQKTYNRASGTDDVPLAVVATGTDVIVTGKSSGSDTLYIAVDYSQFTKTNTLDTATSGGQYVANQIIIRFDPGAVNQDAVNNLDINFAPPSYWLTATADSALQANVPFDLSTCTMERIYKGLKSTYKYSTARNGDQVLIPNLWAAFLLIHPASTASPPTSESAIGAGINALFPMVVHTGLNYVGQFMSGSGCNNAQLIAPLKVNDPYFPPFVLTGGQYSGQQNLSEDTLPAGNICDPYYGINIDSAWVLETGKPFIKVGIYDSGLDGQNADFSPDQNNLGNPGAKANGWDFYNDVSLPSTGWNLSDATGFAHGTMISGIIGAIRNNNQGIAGIAGGTWSSTDINNFGVTLYGMKILMDTTVAGVGGGSGTTFFGMLTLPVADLCNALTMGCTYTDSGYGFGLHVINNSWGVLFDSIGYNNLMQGRALNDSALSELELAFKNVYRNQTTIVAAAGNDQTRTGYPANFYNDWIICVGGANDTGGRYNCGCNGGQTTYLESYAGSCVDLIAPSYTYTNSGYVINTTDYHKHNLGIQLYEGYTNTFDAAGGGTSLAAPHATGTVALLMSYLDSTASVYQNLSPEDAEQLLILSTINSPSGGRNDSVGYGDLNAGGALQSVNKGCKELVHLGKSGTNASGVLEKAYAPITLTEQYTNPLTGVTYNSTTPYLCWVYKESSTMTQHLDSNFVVTNSWARPSSTSLMLAYDSISHTLQPFEHLYLDSISNTSATVSGYYYVVYSAADSSFQGYWGADSVLLVNQDSFRFDYTVLLNNPTVNCHPVDTTPTAIREIQNHTVVSFYPNPTNDIGELAIFTDKGGTAAISIVAIEGQNIQNVYNGELNSGNTNFPIDVSKLASGIYMLTVDIGGQKSTIKFSKYSE